MNEKKTETKRIQKKLHTAANTRKKSKKKKMVFGEENRKKTLRDRNVKRMCE